METALANVADVATTGICRVRCTWDDTGEWLDESEQRLRWCALESD